MHRRHQSCLDCFCYSLVSEGALDPQSRDKIGVICGDENDDVTTNEDSDVGLDCNDVMEIFED